MMKYDYERCRKSEHYYYPKYMYHVRISVSAYMNRMFLRGEFVNLMCLFYSRNQLEGIFSLL